MNSTEDKMIEILKILKKDYGVIAVKSEFETEGSRKDELTKLRDIISKSNLKMYIKIGGCEAIRDLDDCKILGADGIMAPMIETEFAASKFRNAFTKVFPPTDYGNIDKIINLETITAYNNMEKIYKENQNFLNTVVIGRSDFSRSCGIPKTEIEGAEMLEYCKNIINMANDYGFNSAFGGSLSVNSINFINELKDSIDRVETRKIVFDIDHLTDVKEAIDYAIKFEYLYLKNKLNYYQAIVDEDNQRFDDLKNRVDVEL